MLSDGTFIPASSEGTDELNGDAAEYSVNEDPNNIAGDPAFSDGGEIPSIGYYNELSSIPIDIGSRHSSAGVVSLCFDHHEDLIWQGNSVGHVTSYHGPSLRKYSSFQIHQSNPVRQIETFDNGVIMLTQSCIRISQRGGLTMFEAPIPDCDLQCMLLFDSNHVLLGGHQESSLLYDISTGQVVSKIPHSQNDIVLMRFSEENFLCFGHSSGKISVVDPSTMLTTRIIESHSGSLSDFSVCGSSLLSSGFSVANDGDLVIDDFVNMFDLRTSRAIAKSQFDIAPFFVRFFPGMFTNRAIVVSHLGHFQIVDPSGLAIPESLVVHKLGGVSEDTIITACDISATSSAIAFGDNAGLLQLWGNDALPQFNEYANPTEFPDPPSSEIYISYDDYTIPYSVIPMPQTDKPLSSDLPESVTRQRYYETPAVPQEILDKIEYVDFIGYAPLPVGWVRNRVPYKRHEYMDLPNDSSSSRDGSPHASDDVFYPESMPKMYHKLDPPSFTDAGIDEPTVCLTRKFPALENNSINGYANMLLYVFSTFEPISTYIKSHLCKRELCLTCEISCIIDTLKRAPPDYSFIPYNFLRVFGMLPEATALGLVISEFDDSLNPQSSYSKLIQNFNRFVLQQLHQDFQRDEERSDQGEDPVFLSQKVNDLLGLTLEQTSVCKCGNEVIREMCNFTTPLIYPDLFNNGEGPMQYSFAEVVNYSLTTEQTTQAWCVRCKKYQPTNQKKKVIRLPHLLSFNCQLEQARELSFWKVQQKLTENPDSSKDLEPPSTAIGMCRFGNNCTRKDCKFRHEKDLDIQTRVEEFVSDVGDEPWAPMTLQIPGQDSDTLFELIACVMHIPEKNARGHMVAHVKMSGGCYLVNDSLIEPITVESFNRFNLGWMTPCVLYYKSVQMPESLVNLTLPNCIKREFLSDDQKLVDLNPDLRKIFLPLQPDEEFSSSDFLGLDLQIIANCKQETDINPDGTYKTITSTENSMIINRVVCLRGNGAKETVVPLIDDHNQTKETVAEYINKLPSLDLHGGKHMSTFKHTYLKLKYLVHQKVMLVGHGLERKLRQFNLFVPREQLIDTQLLYKLSRQPPLPLKPVAHFFAVSYSSRSDLLKDCYASLQLYNNYLRLTNGGRTMQAFRMSLQEMYNKLKDIHSQQHSS